MSAKIRLQLSVKTKRKKNRIRLCCKKLLFFVTYTAIGSGGMPGSVIGGSPLPTAQPSGGSVSTPPTSLPFEGKVVNGNSKGDSNFLAWKKEGF